MSTVKNLLINQVKMTRPFDRTTIPTKIRYVGRQHAIGDEADYTTDQSSRLFENFKVEVGRISRLKAQTSQKFVSNSYKRSIVGMTKDFLGDFVNAVKSNILAEGGDFPTKVLIAEPLSIEEEGKVSGQWLSNYRANIRIALAGLFEQVDFLPEPFAVFQYYRYGLRHPVLSSDNKHTALVLDFGGGTLDASVIETTNEGDISLSGKNSRPLSAKSIPNAGFFINRCLAEDLLFASIEDKKEKSRIRSVLGKIESFQGIDDDKLSLLGEREQCFAKNFISLLTEVEKAKIRICNSISDWDLTANLHGSVSHTVRIPLSPFEANPDWREVPLRAERLRDVFEQKVWRHKLCDGIKKAIQRSKDELRGRPISIVLLSGGSTNIRWMKALLERDLQSELDDAQILEISDSYQEVVAKGLAIECARQFYTEGDGDFGAVTYNRLNLALRPDEKGLNWCNFKPMVDGLPRCDDDGTLLPSASSLRAFIDRPMRWNARLASAPRRSLTYNYLKSSFDPADISSVHNISDDVVQTPKSASFASTIDVELTVREDGTATPAFIYGRGKDSEARVEGTPFFLDMTFADTTVIQEGYLGLDFGTATSAASVVSRKDISTFTERAKSSEWLELNDLVQKLPYPAAHPLARYITQSDEIHLEKHGRASFEALLMLTGYLSLADLICEGENDAWRAHFKDFKRSAGPLKNLLEKISNQKADSNKLTIDLTRIVSGDLYQLIDESTTKVAKQKHDKRVELDYNHLLTVVGNNLIRSIGSAHIGVFEAIQKKGFKGGYSGVFRCLTGSNQPFVDLFNYDGECDFSPEEVFLVDPTSGRILPLSPFLVWGIGRKADLKHDYDLYVVDQINQSKSLFTYAAVQHAEEISLSDQVNLSDLETYLLELISGRTDLIASNGKFTRRL